MEPATFRSSEIDQQKLLYIDAKKRGFEHHGFTDLQSLLHPGDLLVLNDAATFPAALSTQTLAGVAIELRLIGRPDPAGAWNALVLGKGNWRMATEARTQTPALRPGERLANGATIQEVSLDHPRRVKIHLGSQPWSLIYSEARPIQYSYMAGPLELWDTQTVYASRPWASEMPSAGHPLRWRQMIALLKKGVNFATLTHSTGISSTGDPELDAQLPLPEESDIPESTVQRVHAAHAQRRRVIAVGTSVVRALEGRVFANGGKLVAGRSTTDLLLSRHFKRRVCDAILTGIHDLGESHFRLLEAFCPRQILVSAHSDANQLTYRGHEFGDSCLITA